MFKKITVLLKKHFWLIGFLLFLVLFAWKIFFKGYIIGPFDFLINFYHPYKEMVWQDPKLAEAALHPKTYLMTDVTIVVLPIKLFVIDLIKKFQLPLWNPYIIMGSPILANVQSAVLYPLNILYLIFNQKIAFEIYVLSQLVMAFVFMFLYLRSIDLDKISAYFGSLSFSFSAFFIVWLGWGTLGHTFLWLPLIFYIIEKSFNDNKNIYKIILAISLSLSFFAGHTQTSMVVYGLSLLYLAFKTWQTKDYKTGIRLFIFYLISILIDAIQLIPTAEMYQQSVREIVATESFYKNQTLYFSSYLMSIFPDFFGNPVTRNWWGKINYAESAIYFGTIAFYFLIYYIFDKKNWQKNYFRFFLFLIFISLLISTQNFLSKFIFYLKIPLISSSTFSRYSTIYIFAGSILAALGFHFFIKDLKDKDYLKILRINLLVLILLVFYWALVLLKFLPPEYLTNLTIIKRNSLIPSLLLLTTIFSPLVKVVFEKRIKIVNEKLLAVFIIFIFSFEMWRFAYKYMPFSPPQFFFPDHGLIQTLKKYANNERYDDYMPVNINSYYRISGMRGGEPLYNKNLGELTSLGKNGVINITDRGSLQFPDGPYKPRIMDLLSVKYLVDKTDNSRNTWIDLYGKNDDFDERFKEIWKDGIYKIYINYKALPRQKMFYQVKTIKNKLKLLQRLIAKDFDYQNIALVEKNLNLKFNQIGTNKITILKNEPNWQKYQIRTTQPGLLQVTDTFYPGWNAYVDGVKTEIIKTNYTFRGVVIGKGNHQVDFKYEPLSFKLGAIISAIGVLLLVLFSLKRNKQINIKGLKRKKRA